MPAQKGATKTAPKGKHSCGADDATAIALEQPAQAKRVRTTTSNPKRQREVDNTTSVETELAPPTKKIKTAPKKKKDMNLSPRWSNRTQTNVPATPQRRKQQTREEIAADKAKADAEKRQKEELIKQNRRAMMRTLTEQRRLPKPLGPSLTLTAGLNWMLRNLLATTMYPILRTRIPTQMATLKVQSS